MKVDKYYVPDNLLYTKDHEWVNMAEKEAVVGVSQYASEMLHDIVFVTLPSIGSVVEAKKAIASIESVKSVSDVFNPIDGIITSINAELAQHPELINQDPYGKGWLYGIKPASELVDRAVLMGASEYIKIIEEELSQQG